MDCKYDIIVIGGGHAGAEAAWAAARMGCRAALVTMEVDAITRLSCNPAIGGLAKGQLVREIDALGGLMGLAADAGGIQYRMLNRSKGPAVWAPRAQADQTLYAAAVRRLLESTDGLDLVQGLVDDLIIGEQAGKPIIKGVTLEDGRRLACGAAILTTGTFLRGLMHCGQEQTTGGRVGERSAEKLSNSLASLGFTLGRLKTGTPPRIEKDTVDYDALEVQQGDDPPIPFSYLTDTIDRPQVCCWITYTNEAAHDLIRNNLDRAPMYSGQIKSRGPRYCPSIEDKVVRFPDKSAHQIFLEPEGLDHPWIYCNGIPTSLPRDVQDPIIRSIRGLEKAQIAQYGYAVEYDCVPTDQIDATLESKRVGGLFLAGQINGTSGYEEAAAQGLMAGINAVRKLQGQESVVLGRDQAYIGVLIDDLVTRPPDEPYRMFTSRAEYRLHLRSDNADARLTPLGRDIGLVDGTRWSSFEAKQQQITALTEILARTRLDGRSLAEWLRRPEVTLDELAVRSPELALDGVSKVVREAVSISIKYAGYLQREERQIQRHRKMEERRIPESFDYANLKDLRHEAREKLSRFRPRSIGQAARISGISPADIATLSIHLGR